MTASARAARPLCISACLPSASRTTSSCMRSNCINVLSVAALLACGLLQCRKPRQNINLGQFACAARSTQQQPMSGRIIASGQESKGQPLPEARMTSPFSTKLPGWAYLHCVNGYQAIHGDGPLLPNAVHAPNRLLLDRGVHAGLQQEYLAGCTAPRRPTLSPLILEPQQLDLVFAHYSGRVRQRTDTSLAGCMPACYVVHTSSGCSQGQACTAVQCEASRASAHRQQEYPHSVTLLEQFDRLTRCLPTAAGERHMAQRRVLHVQRFPDQAQRIRPL